MINDLLAETFFGNTILGYFTALGILLAFTLLGRIFYYISNYFLKKQAAKTASRYDDLIIDALEEPAVIVIFGVGLFLSLNTLVLSENARTFSMNAVTAVFVVAGVLAFLRMIDIVLKEYLASVVQKSDSKLDDQLLPVMRKGLKLIVIVVGVLVVMSNFGVDITALIAGLGIGGLALALAAKDTVENLFGAFAIFFDKPFSVGDRVVIDGVTGDVMEVGLRSTRIRTLNNNELYIPNSKVVLSNLENISRPNHAIAQTITLSLTYDTEPEKMKEAIAIVKDVLAKTEGISEKYAASVVFNSFAPSSLDILVKFWVKNYLNMYDVRDAVNQKILERYNKAGLQFAYPTQTVHLKK